MKYSIIIPCYNEEQNLPDLVSALSAFPVSYDVEFILVENGSQDGSRMLFESVSEFDGKRIKGVLIDDNQGYGYGILQGLKIANGDYVGWIHADLQLDPLELTAFFDAISKNKDEDVFLKGERRNRRMVEYFFTIGMGIFDSILFGTWMKDIMAMPVLMPKTLLGNFEDWPYDFTLDIFAYIKAKSEGCKIIHLPVYIHTRIKGKSSWNIGFASRMRMSKKMITGSFEIKKRLSYMTSTHH